MLSHTRAISSYRSAGTTRSTYSTHQKRTLLRAAPVLPLRCQHARPSNPPTPVRQAPTNLAKLASRPAVPMKGGGTARQSCGVWRVLPPLLGTGLAELPSAGNGTGATEMGVLIWEAMSDSRVWYGYSSSIRKKSALWMKKSPVRGGGHGDSGDADVGPGFIVAGFVFSAGLSFQHQQRRLVLST